jgi:multiple sugar transport system ATP-binding protein
MRYEFAKLHEDLKTTMIYVTHDQVEAMTLADRIAVLSAGKIEQVGSPLELYEHPANQFVAGFLGSPRMNFIDAEIVEASATSAVVRLTNGTQLHCMVDASAARKGDKVTLGVRPEDMAVGGGGNVLKVSVTFVEPLGNTTHVYCTLPGNEETLTCEMDGKSRVKAGDELQLSVAPESLYLFDLKQQSFKRLGGAARANAA